MNLDRTTTPDWLSTHVPVSALFYGTWYPARVRKVLPNGAISVLWDGENSQSELSFAYVRPRDHSCTPTLHGASHSARSAHSESERPSPRIDQNMFLEPRTCLERNELAAPISLQVIRPRQPPEPVGGRTRCRSGPRTRGHGRAY